MRTDSLAFACHHHDPITRTGIGLALFWMLVGGPAILSAQGAPRSGERPLALAEATARALANNIELRVTRADTGLALAELVGSRLRPNPSLAVEYLSNGDGRVSLTQDLQLWGVRGYRIRAAKLGQERTRFAALDAERRVRQEVTAAYRELLFLDQRVALLDSLARLNERVARVAKLAFQQGLGSELDDRLSLATYQQSLLDRDAAARELEAGQIDLARLLGDSLTTVYRLTDSLPAAGLRFLLASSVDSSTAPVRYAVDQPRLDSLIQRAMGQRPDLHAAQYDVNAQRATLAAAQAAGKPTVAVGAIYGRTRDDVATAGTTQSTADNGFGLGLVVGLPFGNRNQGEVARARFAGEAATLRLANVRQTVERDIRVAVARVALAASQLETLRRIVLPTNQSALRIAAAAFGRGQVNIFQVLQVQRTYADATTALLDASRRYATSLADLEAAVGAPVQ